jgi:hypothetical protein
MSRQFPELGTDAQKSPHLGMPTIYTASQQMSITFV